MRICERLNHSIHAGSIHIGIRQAGGMDVIK